MEIFLNGKHESSTSTTLMELVNEKGFEASSLIVEVNLSIIQQDDWPKTSLQQGDRIEFLSFVGGG